MNLIIKLVSYTFRLLHDKSTVYMQYFNVSVFSELFLTVAILLPSDENINSYLNSL